MQEFPIQDLDLYHDGQKKGPSRLRTMFEIISSREIF